MFSTIEVIVAGAGRCSVGGWPKLILLLSVRRIEKPPLLLQLTHAHATTESGSFFALFFLPSRKVKIDGVICNVNPDGRRRRHFQQEQQPYPGHSLSKRVNTFRNTYSRFHTSQRYAIICLRRTRWEFLYLLKFLWPISAHLPCHQTSCCNLNSRRPTTDRLTATACAREAIRCFDVCADVLNSSRGGIFSTDYLLSRASIIGS